MSQRKLRPNGEPYSSDRRKRWAELVEDGKVGGRGSALAREHGRLGGRPRAPRPRGSQSSRSARRRT